MEGTGNRRTRRMEARNSGRCNNAGKPMYANLITKEDRLRFKALRHNKKVVKTIKRLTKNNVAYTSGGMKEAKKVVKNPKKYSDKDVRTAERMVYRMGKYNLICLDDYFNSIKRLDTIKVDA